MPPMLPGFPPAFPSVEPAFSGICFQCGQMGHMGLSKEGVSGTHVSSNISTGYVLPLMSEPTPYTLSNQYSALIH